MTDKVLYDWKRLDTRAGETHALYVVMTGKIVGYITKDSLLGIYKLWYCDASLGEFISLEAAKTVMDDITGRTTLQ